MSKISRRGFLAAGAVAATPLLGRSAQAQAVPPPGPQPIPGPIPPLPPLRVRYNVASPQGQANLTKYRLEEELKASEKARIETAEELRRLRERLAFLEGRQAATATAKAPAFSPNNSE